MLIPLRNSADEEPNKSIPIPKTDETEVKAEEPKKVDVPLDPPLKLPIEKKIQIEQASNSIDLRQVKETAAPLQKNPPVKKPSAIGPSLR